MKQIILTIIVIFNISSRYSLPTVYTATTETVTISNISCKTENELLIITSLINSESGNQSIEGKLENFKNLNARRLDYRFPNTFSEVIYQRRQYNGVGTEEFKFNANLYKLVKKWYKENPIGFLYYFNPELATDEEFMEWSNKFTKHPVGDHVYFGKPVIK